MEFTDTAKVMHAQNVLASSMIKDKRVVMGDTRQKHRRNNTSVILDPTLNLDQPFLLFIPNQASLSLGNRYHCNSALQKSHHTDLSQVPQQNYKPGSVSGSHPPDGTFMAPLQKFSTPSVSAS